MNKQNAIIGGVVVLVLAVGAAWALGFFRGTDPAVAELQQMRDAMFANRDLSPDDRREQWQGFRQKLDSLTDQQRQAFRESSRDGWQRFGQQRMNEFFALSPAEQQKRLDQIIDRMIEWQNQPRPNLSGGRGDASGRVGWRGDGGGRGGWRNMTDEQRDQRRKEMIARTDPKMRAQFDQFRHMLDDRRKDRGLPPMEGRPPWRGGFPGGGRGPG
jgi:hypothetical protein